MVTNQKCKKGACKECPFKRSSAPGWLGAASFDGDPGSSFLDPHWIGEMPLPCHMQVKWEADDSREQAHTAPMCFGYLTMLKNNCKQPRDPELAAMVDEMERNTEDYFMHPQEFKDHHNSTFAKHLVGATDTPKVEMKPAPETMFRSAFGEPKPRSLEQIDEAMCELELAVSRHTSAYIYDSTDEPVDSVFHGWTAEIMGLVSAFDDGEEGEEIILYTAGFDSKQSLVDALVSNGVREYKIEQMDA